MMKKVEMCSGKNCAQAEVVCTRSSVNVNGRRVVSRLIIRLRDRRSNREIDEYAKKRARRNRTMILCGAGMY